MGNGFEEAMHHGYSAEEMAADMQEQMDVMRRLGCNNCTHLNDYHVTCFNILTNEEKYIKCPFFKEEKKS